MACPSVLAPHSNVLVLPLSPSGALPREARQLLSSGFGISPEQRREVLGTRSGTPKRARGPLVSFPTDSTAELGTRAEGTSCALSGVAGAERGPAATARKAILGTRHGSPFLRRTIVHTGSAGEATLGKLLETGSRRKTKRTRQGVQERW